MNRLPGEETRDPGPAGVGNGQECPSPAICLPAGKVLSHNFVIEELIGEGGMATVYRAVQKSLNRKVAIKALHPQFTGEPEFVERFQAESGALAALSHPNIVSVIDRGEHDGIYYFVMELVPGTDLDELILESRLKLGDWRRIVAACKDAMDYVHKRSIVHRDIKPSNILVDTEGRVKLSDFGIAHILAGDDGMAGSDASRRAVGTACYMPPEQSSDPGSVDHRADIYSLGVTFYKMLTRQLPVDDDYPSPSEANNSVPVAVDAVLQRAMAPEREHRYASVAEFCDDLLKALKDTSRSVTAIMDYRGAKGPSSLYSGMDFKRGSRGGPNGKGRRDEGTAGARRPPTSASLRRPGRSSTAGIPRRGRRSTGGTTVDAPPPAAAARSKPKRSTHPLLILLGVLIVLLLAVLLVVVIVGGGGDEPTPTRATGTPAPSVEADEPLTGTVSPALEREERLRQFRESLTGTAAPQPEVETDARTEPTEETTEPETPAEPAAEDPDTVEPSPAEAQAEPLEEE